MTRHSLFSILISISILLFMAMNGCATTQNAPVKSVFNVALVENSALLTSLSQLDQALLDIQTEQSSQNPASQAQIDNANTAISQLIAKTDSNTFKLFSALNGNLLKQINQTQKILNSPNTLKFPDSTAGDDEKNQPIVDQFSKLDKLILSMIDSYQSKNHLREEQFSEFNQLLQSLDNSAQTYYIAQNYQVLSQINCIQSIINETYTFGDSPSELSNSLPDACTAIQSIYDPDNIYASDPISRFRIRHYQRKLVEYLYEQNTKLDSDSQIQSMTISDINALIQKIEPIPGSNICLQSNASTFLRINQNQHASSNANATQVVYPSEYFANALAERNATFHQIELDNALDDFYRLNLKCLDRNDAPECKSAADALKTDMATLLYAPGGAYLFFQPERKDFLSELMRIRRFKPDANDLFPWDNDFFSPYSQEAPSDYTDWPAYRFRLKHHSQSFEFLSSEILASQDSSAASSDQNIESLFDLLNISVLELENTPGGPTFLQEHSEKIKQLNTFLSSKTSYSISVKTASESALNESISAQRTKHAQTLKELIESVYEDQNPLQPIPRLDILEAYSKLLVIPGGGQKIYEFIEQLTYLNVLVNLWNQFEKAAYETEFEDLRSSVDDLRLIIPHPIENRKRTDEEYRQNALILASVVQDLSAQDVLQMNSSQYNHDWMSSISNLAAFDLILRNYQEVVDNLVCMSRSLGTRRQLQTRVQPECFFASAEKPSTDKYADHIFMQADLNQNVIRLQELLKNLDKQKSSGTPIRQPQIQAINELIQKISNIPGGPKILSSAKPKLEKVNVWIKELVPNAKGNNLLTIPSVTDEDALKYQLSHEQDLIAQVEKSFNSPLSTENEKDAFNAFFELACMPVGHHYLSSNASLFEHFNQLQTTAENKLSAEESQRRKSQRENLIGTNSSSSLQTQTETTSNQQHQCDIYQQELRQLIIEHADVALELSETAKLKAIHENQKSNYSNSKDSINMNAIQTVIREESDRLNSLRLSSDELRNKVSDKRSTNPCHL